MQPKIITQPHCRIGVVEVPEGNTIFELRPVHSLLCCKENVRQRYWDTYTLPPGDWSILGVWPDITEEQAGMVLDKWELLRDEFLYMDYHTGHYDFTTALESLRSLLTSHGLPVEGKKYVLLIEKK